MTLIVEDGTGKADATSYISIANAKTYAASIGNTAWGDLDDDVLEPALRNATLYLTRKYRRRWAGYRVSAAQTLDWPRSGVRQPDVATGYGAYPNYYPINVVPVEIGQVQTELAIKITEGIELMPDLSPPVKLEKVGPIITEFFQGSRQYTVFLAIESALAPFLCMLSNSFPINRG